MKKLITILVAVTTIFTACQKDPQVTESPAGSTDSRTTQSKDILSFDSEDAMNHQIHELKLMGPEALASWYQSNGNFQSQNEFMWDVVEELNNSSSMEDVRATQAKYKDLLLFNNNESDEDIAPYIPSNHRGTELVCNKYGNVLVNGEVKNFNNLTAYEQTKDYEINQARKERRVLLHGGSAVDGKRKFWVELYLNRPSGWVEVQLSAHKKTWIGWNKYSTVYVVRLNEFLGFAKTGPFLDYLRKEAPNFVATAEIASGSYIPLGWGIQPSANNTSVALSAYSRGVGAGNVRHVRGVVGR